MENNRAGINKEAAPKVTLENYLFFSEVGDRGLADVEFEVIGHKLVEDEQGNEIMKYVVQIISINKKEMNGARIV